MTRPIAFLIFALMMVSLGMKSWALAPGHRGDQASIASERANIVRWMTRNGFVHAVADGGLTVVAGARGDCRLMIVVLDPRGFQRDVLADLRPAGSTLYYVYRGERLDAPPMWSAWARHQRWARGREMGIRVVRDVPLAVFALGCDSSAISWTGLGRIV